MDNKMLGIVLIVACLLLGALIFAFTQQLNINSQASCSCTEMQNGGTCPMQKQTPWQTYAGIILVSAIAALGIYLIFFEKSQKAIISTLEKQKQLQGEEERFDILLKGLDIDEKKVIRAVKEQDGITQQTLRLRTDMHKSKLSIVLDSLEGKGLVKRVPKGKTNLVFIKAKV
jgi:uncharacterized membrane protein